MHRRLQCSGSTWLLVVASLAAGACGGATHHPVADSPPQPSEDLPVSDTAFTEETPATRSEERPRDRFATRRIGADVKPTGYRGPRVDVDLEGVDLHDVFRLLADVGKANIVVSGEVGGRVTLRLRQVAWDQAMDVVARAHGLVYEREANVILVRRAAGR